VEELWVSVTGKFLYVTWVYGAMVCNYKTVAIESQGSFEPSMSISRIII
jgi:hypothetical protein